MDSNLTDTQIPLTPPQVKVEIKQTKVAKDPPLFSFQITNPVTYLKAWWKKLLGNDGIKLTIQIKPLTALALAMTFGGAGFGFGRLTLPEPLIQYIPATPLPTPQASPDPWKATAFTGKLQYASNKYFLTTTSA